MQHITVLMREAVESLSLTSGSTVVDATYGAGGHATAIARRLGKQGTLIAIDADSTAFTSGTPKCLGKIHSIVGNFRQIDSHLSSIGIATVNAVLADLGWRTDQFTDGQKGFSFSASEPLLMTYGDPAGYLFTASDVVNTWSESSLADVIYGYGEERAARRIAAAIVAARSEAPIMDSATLSDIITAVIPRRATTRIHPATKTFQALRVVVNDELGALSDFITNAWSCLAKNGRLSIITFHSLEDRIVKRQFRSWHDQGDGLLVTKKPIIPTIEEIRQNPRSRSAKLRTIVKL